MPRIRSGRREDKRDEIVVRAEERLRAGGYDGLSVSALARELEIAQNSIYWYFPSKDHVFVAAIERILRTVAASKPVGDVPAMDRILWFTDRFAPIWGLSGAVHRRRQHSEVVEAFAARLDAAVTTMLTNALRVYVAEPELARAVETFRTVVEGTYARHLSRTDRHRILRHVVALMSADVAQ